MQEVLPVEKRYKTCAVVGNSGNMLLARFGSVIDRHQVVFRLNKAPTEGYKAHVGTKMTYRFLNKRQFRVYAAGGVSAHHVEPIPDDMEGNLIASRSPPDQLAVDMAAMRRMLRKRKKVRLPPEIYPSKSPN